jgi:hypothetical protein
MRLVLLGFLIAALSVALASPASASSTPPAPAASMAQSTQCDINYLKGHPAFYPLLKAAADGLRGEGIRKLYKGRAILNNILACGTGKIIGRVEVLRRNHTAIALAKGLATLHFSSPGRVKVDLKPTHQGRLRLKDARRLRVRVFIEVFDGAGASVKYNRRVSLERAGVGGGGGGR